ncbi:MAG: glycosyltransferase, partial [Chloroflexota bacterium]|nr:glycosyltransferase [Chloroflexota bacterium]
MRPIRILQVLEATIGGTKRHLLDLCTLLDPEKFQVTVACPRVRSEHHGDTSFVAELREAGIAVEFVPMVRRINPFADARSLWRLARVVRRGRFDVIHAHSSKAGFVGRQAALFDRRAWVVYSPHGFYFLNFNNPLKVAIFKWVERLAGRSTDILIALSKGEHAEALRQRVVSAER